MNVTPSDKATEEQVGMNRHEEANGEMCEDDMPFPCMDQSVYNRFRSRKYIEKLRLGEHGMTTTSDDYITEDKCTTCDQIRTLSNTFLVTKHFWGRMYLRLHD